jgi:cytochrome c oxidase cbb3-type subunit III
MKAIITYLLNHKKTSALLIALGLPMGMLHAETFNELIASEQGLFMLMIGSFLLVISVLMMVLLYFLVQLKNVIFKNEAVKETAWDRFYVTYISGKHAPVGQEADKMMDHEYDGIREMDHAMPPWLKYVFIGTILFGVYYTAAYLVFDSAPRQLDEYAEQMEEARLLAEARQGDTPPITAETAVLDMSKTALANGKQIFELSCAPCHAKDGGGTIGPNLTDEYWIHGGSLADVFKVIAEGVPAKGMIPWKDQLSPKTIQDVSNFVLSLQGTTPANPKKPEGEKYVPEQEKEAVAEENGLASI